jgi:hypothetical protein
MEKGLIIAHVHSSIEQLIARISEMEIMLTSKLCEGTLVKEIFKRLMHLTITKGLLKESLDSLTKEEANGKY